jgi:hypothetical protein
LTNVAGAVSALTEYSPAISWARRADRLAFTYYEDAEYTVWAVNNPRALKKAPYREPPPAPVVAASPPVDSVVKIVSVQALLDSFDFALPDTTKFRINPYRMRFQADYVTRPSIGYSPDAFGRNVFGGTTVVLSDMLGNNHLAISGELNGREGSAGLLG